MNRSPLLIRHVFTVFCALTLGLALGFVCVVLLAAAKVIGWR